MAITKSLKYFRTKYPYPFSDAEFNAHMQNILKHADAALKMADELKKCVAAIESDEMKSVLSFCSVHGFKYKGPTIDTNKLKDFLRTFEMTKKGVK